MSPGKTLCHGNDQSNKLNNELCFIRPAERDCWAESLVKYTTFTLEDWKMKAAYSVTDAPGTGPGRGRGPPPSA